MLWLCALLLTAQVVQTPAQAPLVTAADAAWQLRGDPVFYSGDFYYPSGPSVFFDGNVMVRSGVYEGVPLYVDATLTPYSIVFVPIGGDVMRPYERRRDGDLAGTVGSRMPSFPVEPGPAAAPPGPELPVVPESARPVGTTGARQATSPAVPASRPAIVQSLPRPSSNRGIWISYRGVRWYSAGDAVSYLADRFVRVGTYKGSPVYRARKGRSNEIYVPVVTGGALAPFRKG